MKKKKKSLFWTSLHCMESCGQKFLYKYGAPGIDLGGGPGKPKPKPEKRSEHHMLMGIVIQWVIEQFYNDSLWLDHTTNELVSTQDLVKTLTLLTKKKFRAEIRDSYIDWQASPDHGDLLDVCLQGVMGYLKTMKEHQLIGEENKAEHFMMYTLEGNVPIGAKPDVIIKREHLPGRKNTGYTIIDGKNSGKREEYQHPDQLRLYALVFYLKYGVMPDRLGFVYYRYPFGYEHEDGTIDTGVDWIPFDKEDLEGIAQRCVDASKRIDAQDFVAVPEPPKCRFCDWESVCPQRQAQRKENAKNRKSTKKVVPDEDVTPLDDGPFSAVSFE